MSGGVGVLVFLLLAYAVFRKRKSVDRLRDRTTFVVMGGFVLPLIVLSAVMGLTVDTLGHLERKPPADALKIDISARDWWWDVTYPDSGARTANEIHIPVGRPVAITGTSEDVIHSFWVPQLAGKWDFIPGKPVNLKIQADDIGVYRGQCAEFCGLSHANMIFFIVVQSQSDFDAWLAHQAKPAAPAVAADSRAAQGRNIFFGSSCSACHGIRGSSANGTVGPDLTHLASRDRIAGATLKNNAENLADWISDPRSIKPGANMPSFNLNRTDLDALVAFLQSLE